MTAAAVPQCSARHTLNYPPTTLNRQAYLQTCLVPARDLFVAANGTVASVVVVPLVSGLFCGL